MRPVVLIKVGTVGDKGGARINHVVCKTWDPESVSHLDDVDAKGERVVPDCFLPGDECSFECIIKPDGEEGAALLEALKSEPSKHNRGVTIKEMEAAQPFSEHVAALLDFLDGKTIAAFSLGHVKGSLNRELERLAYNKMTSDRFTHVSPRLTAVFKKEKDKPADRKLDTYAQYFGVERRYHAAERCNAAKDVEVLAKVYSHLVALEAKHDVKAVSYAAALKSVGMMPAPVARDSVDEEKEADKVAHAMSVSGR